MPQLAMGRERLAFNKTEAAKVLGVSVDFFDDHVSHELPCVRRGRRRLYPVSAIERWLEQESERVEPARVEPVRRIA